MSVTWPATLAADLLASAVACYSVADAPEVPDRRAVLHGAVPALDCPLLAVVIGPLQARPDPGAPRCAVRPRIRLVVWIARCVPTLSDDGTAPPLAEEEAAALGLAADLGTLWDGLTARWHAGTLFPSFDGLNCEAVTWELATPHGPQGGLAGWQIPLLIDVTGVR